MKVPSINVFTAEHHPVKKHKNRKMKMGIAKKIKRENARLFLIKY